jgi:hypothetical protein
MTRTGTGLRRRGPVFYTPGMRVPWRKGIGLVLGCALGMGCSPQPRGADPDEIPAWPYAGITAVKGIPPELQGQPRFLGRWIEGLPGKGIVFVEATEPRYVARLSFDAPHLYSFFDLGMGVEVETLGFSDDGRSVFLVGAAISPQMGRSVYSRAILELDLEIDLLIDTIGLPRHGMARGFGVDASRRRAFLLSDDGAGEGTLQKIDLYGGGVVQRVSTGVIPAAVGRKGLALDRNARKLFCLAGGDAARSDFEPVREGEPQGPEILVLDADSLSITARIPLDPELAPRAVAHSQDRELVYVLEANQARSRLVIVDAAFSLVRRRVDLPEETTDLVITGGYAFAPGAHGIYIVDLHQESWISRPSLPFEVTGEMTVSQDHVTALVLFQSATAGGTPGIAEVALQSGSLVRVIR